MKRSVKLSTYSTIVTAIGLIVLLACLYYCRDNWGIYAIGALIVIACSMALFYMPLSISVNDEDLNINRSLRIKRIPLKEIKSVELCPPTMAEHRIFGSGGWFGYWGWFTEPSMGRYFAYYGKASDCFLVELKNGNRYLLGCEDAPVMVDHITSRLRVFC